MANRMGANVKVLRLTEKQVQEAVQRATNNAKNWTVWKDPKASKPRKAKKS